MKSAGNRPERNTYSVTGSLNTSQSTAPARKNWLTHTLRSMHGMQTEA
jgi:hypothetical protein